MTLAPRIARAALFVLAAAVARKRPGLRPVAASLGVLACLDIARGVGLPARADVAAWLAWPGVWAALAVRVWREPARPLARSASVRLALAWIAYAVAVALAPWAAHPSVYGVAIRVPHVVACAVALWSWASQRGPGDAHARVVAGVLAISGLVDVVAGAWAGPWRLAAPLSWATIAACAVVIVSAGRR